MLCYTILFIFPFLQRSNGCVCPQEFTGPHCEHLREQYDNYESTLHQTEDILLGPPPPEMNLVTPRRIDTASLMVSLGFIFGVLGIVLLVLKRNKRRSIDSSRGNHELLVDDDEQSFRTGRVEFH